jgi:hypothetical protein
LNATARGKLPTLEAFSNFFKAFLNPVRFKTRKFFRILSDQSEHRISTASEKRRYRKAKLSLLQSSIALQRSGPQPSLVSLVSCRIVSLISRIAQTRPVLVRVSRPIVRSSGMIRSVEMVGVLIGRDESGLDGAEMLGRVRGGVGVEPSARETDGTERITRVGWVVLLHRDERREIGNGQ